jgi:cold shock CspA family protein
MNTQQMLEVGNVVKGEVKFVCEDKGFGFIYVDGTQKVEAKEGEDPREELFFHITGYRHPIVGHEGFPSFDESVKLVNGQLPGEGIRLRIRVGEGEKGLMAENWCFEADYQDALAASSVDWKAHCEMLRILGTAETLVAAIEHITAERNFPQGRAGRIEAFERLLDIKVIPYMAATCTGVPFEVAIKYVRVATDKTPKEDTAPMTTIATLTSKTAPVAATA